MTPLSGPQIERALRTFVGEELASAQRLERYPALGSLRRWVPHTSNIVQRHSQPEHREGEVYSWMLERCIPLSALWKKRVDAVRSLPRDVQPADASPAAIEAATFARFALAQIPQFHDALGQLLMAPAFGLQIAEIVWGQVTTGEWAGAWVPVDLVDRPQHRFRFDRDHRLHVRRPIGQGTPNDDAELAPPAKFLVLRAGSRDTPWGTAELDRLYWAHYLWVHGAKFWAVAVERYAQPIPKGKYKHRSGGGTEAESANTEQQQALLRMLQTLQTEGAIVHPDSTEVELLWANSGNIAYEAFEAGLERLMTLHTLGEVDTSGAGKGPGSYAKAEVSNEVRGETIESDAHRVASAWNEQLMRWLILVNFGPKVPAARLVIDTGRDDRDLADRRAGITEARSAGLPVSENHARRVWRVPVPVPGEALLAAPAPAPPAGPAPQPPNDPAADVQAAMPLLSLFQLSESSASLAGQINRELDDVSASFAAEGLSYWSAQRDALAAAWEANPATALESATVALGDLARVHADALLAAMVHGAGFGRLDLERELGPAVHTLAAPPPNVNTVTTPGAASQLWEQLFALPRPLFQLLSDRLRRYAFTVAGVTSAEMLVEVQLLIARAAAEQWTRAAFATELDALYARRGLSPTSRWHANLLYSNGVRAAYGLQRYLDLVESEAGARIAPYLEIASVEDDKVRERVQHNHVVIDGWVGANGHPLWAEAWNPFGHNCRCLIRAISAPAARRRGLTGLEPVGPVPIDPLTGVRWRPDPGFRGAPTRRLEDQQQRAEERVRDARPLDPNSDLGRALAALLGRLGLGDLLS